MQIETDAVSIDDRADAHTVVAFTSEHARMLEELHQAVTSIAAQFDNLIPMLKNSPLGSMFGL